MIIVVRGTNGSGKSHAMREIIRRGRLCRGTPDGVGVVMRFTNVTQPVVIVGPYEKDRSMGGCDCIRQPSKIYRLIDWTIHRRYHVALEGVVLATRPWFEYMRDGHDVRYAFLDTPIPQCLENIRKRQTKKGHKSVLSSDAMHSKWERAQEMFDRAQREGMVSKRFEVSTDVVHWIGYQLRRAS